MLRFGAAAAVAAAAPITLGGCSTKTSGSSSPSSSSPAAPNQRLAPPKALHSQAGVLAVTLTAMPAMVDLGAPRKASTYTYDGVIPGHTWELFAGDTLDVELVNSLPALSGHDHPSTMTRPHEWTHTNLHTHGLHVSPAGNGDNVFVDIPPGERFKYHIPVPANHTGGIFWYHPHRHGAVTQQVRGGMAGLIVVRGEIDEVEEVKAAHEQIMVLQAIELGTDYELLDPIPNPTTEEAFFPRKQILYTVNGALTPKITMRPGEVQRWRILNAAEGKFMSLRLVDHDLHVLAWDGLTLHEPEPATDVMLSAGNRVELMVKAGPPGAYDLVLSPGSSQVPDIPGMPDSTVPSPSTTAPTLNAELRPRPIATIEVTGDRKEMALPHALPAFDPPIRPIARTRQFAFTVERGPGNEFISFGIDGAPFDPAREPYRMKLGTAEEWTLVNQLDAKLPRHAHGLHIHVNPFRITKINGVVLPKPLWRDTFVLTGGNGDSLTFQSNFDDFTGRFVEHCHVLSHEDLGMMEALEVTT